ncbi:MAG: hypothetical protein P8075_10295 [Deltaproteobacteria bacterium]
MTSGLMATIGVFALVGLFGLVILHDRKKIKQEEGPARTTTIQTFLPWSLPCICGVYFCGGTIPSASDLPRSMGGIFYWGMPPIITRKVMVVYPRHSQCPI